MVDEIKRRLKILGYKNIRVKNEDGVLATDPFGGRFYFEFSQADNALSKWEKDGKTFIKMMASKK